MDLRKLKTILELFEKSNLQEIEFSEGEERIRLQKPVMPAPPPRTQEKHLPGGRGGAEGREHSGGNRRNFRQVSHGGDFLPLTVSG